MSGLEDLYREIILDHYRSPRNRGELTPPAHKSEGYNPLCGDEIVLYLIVDDDGLISDIKTGGQGCSISQSSASMMSEAIKGKPVAEARRIMAAFKSMMSIHESSIGEADEATSSDQAAEEPEVKLGELEALRGVVKHPPRIKCATLSWHTLNQAFEEIEV